MVNQPCSICSWDKSGRGIAEYVRSDGRTILVAVPGSIVGEVCEISPPVKLFKGGLRYESRVCALISPSPYRVEPLCPHVAYCGGCVWQHIEPQYQQELKQQRLTSLFGQIGVDQKCIQPIIGSTHSWHYRNKMEFSFSQDREGRRFLGLFQQYRRRSVFNLEVCLLANPWMVETLSAIREWWGRSGLAAYRPSGDSGSLQTVTMRGSVTTGDRMVVLTVSGNPDFALRNQHLAEFVSCVQSAATPTTGLLSIMLRIRQIARKRETQWFEMVLFGPDHLREELTVEPVKGHPQKLRFVLSPQAFFQPNTLQAMQLYSSALHLAELRQDQVLFDLYCGIGIIGMFASFQVRRVVGVELSKESAYDAKINSHQLGLSNFSILCGDVGTLIQSLEKEGASTVIVDPPRAGLAPHALKEILSLQPETIVYISCNPESQARDAALLIQQGWKIQTVQPIDQFPHTPHIESVLCAHRSC